MQRYKKTKTLIHLFQNETEGNKCPLLRIHRIANKHEIIQEYTGDGSDAFGEDDPVKSAHLPYLISNNWSWMVTFRWSKNKECEELLEFSYT